MNAKTVLLKRECVLLVLVGLVSLVSSTPTNAQDSRTGKSSRETSTTTQTAAPPAATNSTATADAACRQLINAWLTDMKAGGEKAETFWARAAILRATFPALKSWQVLKVIPVSGQQYDYVVRLEVVSSIKGVVSKTNWTINVIVQDAPKFQLLAAIPDRKPEAGERIDGASGTHSRVCICTSCSTTPGC